MDTWTHYSTIVNVDGEPVRLPSWAVRSPVRPPSHSTRTRLDVFDYVRAEGELFDVFASGKMKDIEFAAPFLCGICFGYLQDPAPCPSKQCKFIACRHCLEMHYQNDSRCPVCRRAQDVPDVNEHLEPFLAEELRRRGISFRCNLDPPGSHEGALWCCERTFDSLQDFKRHVTQQCSFQATRLECKRQMREAFSSSSQDTICQVQDSMREQIRYILYEDAVLLHLGKSYRSTTRETETCMYPEVAAEDLLEGASRVQDAFAAVVQNVGNMIASIRARSRSPRRSAEIEDFEAAVQDVGNMIASIRARSRSPRRSAEIEDSSSDTD